MRLHVDAKLSKALDSRRFSFSGRKRFGKYFFPAFFAVLNPGLAEYSSVVRTHWWLRSYSSQAFEGCKLKAECLFLICLVLLFALNCNFSHVLS